MSRPRLEHIGIATADADRVTRLYERLFGYHVYKTEQVASEGVETVFLSAGTAKLELLTALTETSAIAKFLDKRGQGIHHLAFEVADIQATFSRLKSEGFTPLADPKQGADGKLIFFLHPKETEGILVEFCQSVPQPLVPKMIPFRDTALATYTWGAPSAPPLVLLHGAFSATALDMRNLARRLAPHFHVLALDFTGHGASPDLPEIPFSFDLFVENIRTLLDHYEVSFSSFFGFSMGAAAALVMAIQHPERVTKLTMSGAKIFWTDRDVALMNRRLDMAYITEHHPRMAHGLGAVHTAFPPLNLAEKLKRFTVTIPHLDIDRKALKNLSIPLALIAGQEDPLQTLDEAFVLYRRLPDGTAFTVLPHVNHEVPTGLGLELIVAQLLQA